MPTGNGKESLQNKLYLQPEQAYAHLLSSHLPNWNLNEL